MNAGTELRTRRSSLIRLGFEGGYLGIEWKRIEREMRLIIGRKACERPCGGRGSGFWDPK